MKTKDIMKFAVVFYFTTSFVRAIDRTASKALHESKWFKELKEK